MKGDKVSLYKIIALLIVVISVWSIISSLITLVQISSGGLESQLNKLEQSEMEELEMKFAESGLDYGDGSILAVLVFGLVFVIALGIFILILGIKLWQRRNWARVTIVVLAYIYAFLSLIAAFTASIWSLIDFVLALIIALYLNFSKEVKEEFGKKKPKSITRSKIKKRKAK